MNLPAEPDSTAEESSAQYEQVWHRCEELRREIEAEWEVEGSFLDLDSVALDLWIPLSTFEDEIERDPLLRALPRFEREYLILWTLLAKRDSLTSELDLPMSLRQLSIRQLFVAFAEWLYLGAFTSLILPDEVPDDVEQNAFATGYLDAAERALSHARRLSRKMFPNERLH